MHAIKAIYDGTNFNPLQPVPVNENYEVIITFVEPAKKETGNAGVTAKLPRSTAKGVLKGKVRMADDFNAPLDEMKAYME